MYETSNEFGTKSTIGKAAEQFLSSSGLLRRSYGIKVSKDEYRVGY